jgi:1,4-alpha-glucan branching enzyme
MFFQGQEFLQGGWFRDDAPLDWDQSDTYRGMVRLYRDLVALRLDRQGSTAGLCGHHTQVLHANEAANILAFHRWDHGGAGDSTVVVVNLAAEERADYRIGLPAQGVWRVRFNSDAQCYGDAGADRGPTQVEAEASSYDGQPCSGHVGLGPYAVLVLSQDRQGG